MNNHSTMPSPVYSLTTALSHMLVMATSAYGTIYYIIQGVQQNLCIWYYISYYTGYYISYYIGYYISYYTGYYISYYTGYYISYYTGCSAKPLHMVLYIILYGVLSKTLFLMTSQPPLHRQETFVVILIGLSL